MQHARQANLKQYAVLKDITARQALRTASAANPQIRLYVKGRMDSQNAAQLTAPQLRGVEKSAAFQSKCALMGLAAIMAKNV
jgi:hypothetical protein